MVINKYGRGKVLLAVHRARLNHFSIFWPTLVIQSSLAVLYKAPTLFIWIATIYFLLLFYGFGLILFRYFSFLLNTLAILVMIVVKKWRINIFINKWDSSCSVFAERLSAQVNIRYDTALWTWVICHVSDSCDHFTSFWGHCYWSIHILLFSMFEIMPREKIWQKTCVKSPSFF